MSNREFNPDEPLAYLLTWTTYGTWLPGDDRGWNRKDVAANQPPDSLFRAAAESRMTESAFTLSESHREIVERTIHRHCEIRNWQLHAISVRSNHVHVVVTARGYKPETVRDQFKAWCTRKLKQAGESRENFWTEGCSQRWINCDDDLESAVVYVLEAQDRKGREAQ